MPSPTSNFDFLRPTYGYLADEAGSAERYVHSDPSAALWKLRIFTERVVAAIYVARNLPRPARAELYDCLQEIVFKKVVPAAVIDKLDLLRLRGNRAAHGDQFPAAVSLQLLQDAFDVAQWFYITIGRGRREAIPPYTPPPKAPPDPAAEVRARAAKLEEELQLQRAKFEEILAEAEENRRKLTEAERAAADSAEELARIKAEGEKVAKTLAFDETLTRRKLIDALLIEAGWDVGENGKSTDEVEQEVPLTKVPKGGEESGDGRADYVLWGDNGKPLAVIEAKKAAKSMEEGRVQAWAYAIALEKEHGVLPVIFYTNGQEIAIWDCVTPAGSDPAYRTTPRRIWAFYSKASVEYLIAKRARRPLATMAPDLRIVNRLYQIEAIQRVGERFQGGMRSALLVQATGTGKTRIAIALCDVLLRGGWAQRILFLCDRKELRKQAYGAFGNHLPEATRIIVTGRLSVDERTKGRIFFGTYPAMMNLFESFDPGFFDVVIADESHRSIYNKYADLFHYFDALQVGLTATPVRYVDRNTYRLFGCEDKLPTARFELEDAVNHIPPYLVRPKVIPHTTKFLRQGIKYSQMSEEERAALEADIDDPREVEFEANEIDRQIFNKDTTRQLLRSLMEHGIRDATGTRPGKTIIFARSHRHAEHIRSVFEETYPQYGGLFAAIIDNQEPRAEQLIEDFKDDKTPGKEPVIAISVDMLDTGIDIPEIVNLVFAKPVKSYVKFWQMLGRGTRLRPDLFGPGKDKAEFYVFDPWQNFEFFGEGYEETEPERQKSLLERLFLARIELLAAAIDAMDEPLVQQTTAHVVLDIEELRKTKSLSVRERWRELELLADPTRVAPLSPATRADLARIAPLMKERNIRGEEAAYRFDLLATELQTELLRKGGRAADLRAAMEESVELLVKSHPAVKAKAGAVEQVRSKDFWKAATARDIEPLREDLRGVMKHRTDPSPGSVAPLVVDVPDEAQHGESYHPKLAESDVLPYRDRVRAVIVQHFANDPVLLCIRARKPVTEPEIEHLARLILEVDDRADLKVLAAHDPATRGSLAATLRGLVGLDPKAVEAEFAAFVQSHPTMTAQQTQFLATLQHHIAKNGGMEVDRLFEDPFTALEDIFVANDANEIYRIVELFAPLPPSEKAS